MKRQPRELGALARSWFDVIRACGGDVHELLHDGHPTACVGDAGLADVNVFKAHVNVGFFRGAEMADSAGLLEGSGKFMRHVKLRPDDGVDAIALQQLIVAAYGDMLRRVRAEAMGADATKSPRSKRVVTDGRRFEGRIAGSGQK